MKENEMEKMEKMEKMVDELVDIFEEGKPFGKRAIARSCLARILKAVVDGELELAGQQFYLGITPCFFDQVRKLGLQEGDILIALRPES
jgi:hypothetical protein